MSARAVHAATLGVAALCCASLFIGCGGDVSDPQSLVDQVDDIIQNPNDGSVDDGNADDPRDSDVKNQDPIDPPTDNPFIPPNTGGGLGTDNGGGGSSTQNVVARIDASEDIGGVAPLEVVFQGTRSSAVDADIIEYYWDFGDGETAFGEVVSHTYIDGGVYMVSLTVTDDLGENDTQTLNMIVLPDPVIRATPPSGNAEPPVTVTLEAYSPEDPDTLPSNIEYTWTFGDGTTLTGRRVERVYDRDGVFAINLSTRVGQLLSTRAEPLNFRVLPEGAERLITADAGQNGNAHAGDLVELDASGSLTAGDLALSYAWFQLSGPRVYLDNPAALQPLFEAPEFEDDATLVFELRVTDGYETAVDTVTIHLTGTDGDDQNAWPVADAGLDRSLTDDDEDGYATVRLDGSDSYDPDGQIAAYTWFDDGGAQLATGAAPQVTLATGTHVLTLRVTDDAGASDEDTVRVTVGQQANTPPIADAGPNPQKTDHDDDGVETVLLNGGGSYDPDGSIVAWRWLAQGGAVLATGETANVTLDVGTHTITLQVEDNQGALSTDTVTATVSAADNQPPTADAGGDISTTAEVSGNANVALDASNSADADGAIVSYVWYDDNDLQLATGPRPSITLPVGTHVLTLVVTDDQGATAAQSITVVVQSPPNHAPVADAGQDRTIEDPEGDGESIQLSASASYDSDGVIVLWQWTHAAPAPIGVPSVEEPVINLPPGVHQFELKVYDNRGASSTDWVTITIEATGAPTAKVFTPVQVTADVGATTARVTLSDAGSSDPDGTIVSYDWYNAFDQASGPIGSGQSVEVEVPLGGGVYVLRVTDNDGKQATDVVFVTVNKPGELVTYPADPIAFHGELGADFDVYETSLTIGNAGDLDCDWTAAVTQDWLELNLESGTFSPGDSLILKVALSAAADSLPAGTYHDTLTLTNTTNNWGDREIDVTLTIDRPATLDVVPAENFVSLGTPGGPFTPATKAYTLTNSGDVALEWSANKSATWLNVAPVGGVLDAGASVNVTVSFSSGANGFGKGVYTDTISFQNHTNGVGGRDVAVNLNILNPAALHVNPQTPLVATGGVGDTLSDAQQYTLSNTGDVALDWSATASDNWVTVTPLSGTIAAGDETTVTVALAPAVVSGLSAGQHDALVTFTNDVSGLGDQAIAVELTLLSDGVLTASPDTAWPAVGPEGGPFTDDRTFTLRNTGEQALSWSASADASWLSFSATSGNLAAGGQTTVTASVNASANVLADGTHHGVITFTNDDSGATLDRAVTLTVQQAGLLSVVPVEFNSIGVQGGPFSPSTKAFALTNTGDLPITWTASKTQPWLDLSATSDTLAGGASTTVTASLNAQADSLTPGVKTDTITFSDPQGSVARSVELNVLAPADLEVTDAADFSGTGPAGGPFDVTPKTYTLKNTGDVTLHWTAAASQTWLALSATSGTLSARQSVQLTVSLDAAPAGALSVGAHQATITLSNTTNGNGSTTRGATLTALAPGTLAVTPADGLAATGPQGGPFDPNHTSKTFTLENTGAAPLDWSAAKSADWTTLSAQSGTLVAGATTTLTVSLNSNAEGYAVGTHQDVLTLTNETNGRGDTTRPLALAVTPRVDALAAPFTTRSVSIDGIVDPTEWTDANAYDFDALNAVPLGVVVQGAEADLSDTSATVYVMHDGDYVYVAVDVTDDTVVAAADFVWEEDVVELFLDHDNSNTPDVGVDRMQIDAGAGGDTVTTASVPGGAWSAKGSQHGGGYAVEFRLSKADFGLITGSYGFDLAINDAEPTGGTIETRYWLFAGSSGGDPAGDESQWGTLTLEPGPGILAVDGADFASTGPEGGVFSPVSATYTLENTGDAALTWNAAVTENWLTLSSETGTLQAGASVDVTVYLAGAALSQGDYNDTIVFTNATTPGLGDTSFAADVAVTEPLPDGGPMTTATRTSGYGPLLVSFDAVSRSSFDLTGDTVTGVRILPSSYIAPGTGRLYYRASDQSVAFAAPGDSVGAYVPLPSNGNQLELVSGNGQAKIQAVRHLTVAWAGAGLAGIKPLYPAAKVEPGVGTLRLTGGADGAVLVEWKAPGDTGFGPQRRIDNMYTPNGTYSVLQWQSADYQCELYAEVTPSALPALSEGEVREANVNVTAVGLPSGDTSETFAISDAYQSGVAQPADGDYFKWCYEWDFGDPGSGVWAPDNASRNAGTGFVYAHVYETPGTYTARLTITLPDGSQQLYSQEIEVLAWDGATETYYVRADGNDNANGLTDGTAWATIGRVQQHLNARRAGDPAVRYLFKRGDVFSASSPLQPRSDGPGLFGAYGDAADPRPIINTSSDGVRFGGDDWRVTQIDLRTTNQYANGIVCDSTHDNLLAYQMRLHGFSQSVGWDYDYRTWGHPCDNFGLVDCEMPYTSYVGLFIGGQHLALLGNSMDEVGQAHGFRLWQANKSVIAHNFVSTRGAARTWASHAIKLHAPEFQRVLNYGHPSTEYVVISDNSFEGYCPYGIAFASQNVTDERVAHVLFERNQVFSNETTQYIMRVAGQDMMLRNNIFDGTGGTKYCCAVRIDANTSTGPDDVNAFPTKRISLVGNTLARHEQVAETGSRFSLYAFGVSSKVYDTLVRNNLSYRLDTTDVSPIDSYASVNLVADHNVETTTSPFVDVAAEDYRIAAGASDVRGAAVASPYLWDDFFGNTRPDTGIDVGASQYQP